MTILNYTTTVSAEKSVAQIQKMLAQSHAEKIMFDYEAGLLEAISFQLRLPDNTTIAFKMPSGKAGVAKILAKAKVSQKFKTPIHAANVAWRIQKDWIEAQLAKVQAGMAEMSEVFMPYMITDNGQRLFERVQAGGLKAIGFSGE